MRETVSLLARTVKWFALLVIPTLVVVQAWINPSASPEYLNVTPGGTGVQAAPRIPASCWTSGEHGFPTHVYATVDGVTRVYGAPYVGQALNEVTGKGHAALTVIAFCR